MSSVQFKKSVQDIIPTYHGQFPVQLLSYIESLYLSSLHKKPILPNNAAVARYHLCAYLGVEQHQHRYDLPQPEMKRIPLEPKVASKLLDDFRVSLVVKSNTSSPRNSPTKTNKVLLTPSLSPNPSSTTTPSKSGSPSTGGSPLKRLREIEDSPNTSEDISTPNKLNDSESIFNPTPKNKKKIKSSPEKSAPKYNYDKKHVSIIEFITFCNNFYIPADVSPKMIETFLIHKHKFAKKSEWLLACGIIFAAYVRINHILLTTKIGAQSEFLNLLFQYQKGGLLKINIQLWCNIVGTWIKEESWVKDLEHKYLYGKDSVDELQSSVEDKARIGAGWNILEQFGVMIHGEVLYESDNQVKYYETWSNRVNQK
ncbi:origin recognition complex, subunit 6 [Scheffersomyces coipomensis]|uniref:origin recognition complex, subunit 6 n=1 Tax=Scheffersomyces coipomensis TaxID=1788519 RepID=UPI00315D8738